jgi:hypothetical protein
MNGKAPDCCQEREKRTIFRHLNENALVEQALSGKATLTGK